MSEEKQFHVKRIHLNGVPKRIVADPGVTLLTVIRDQQKLTGTKRGCNCGQCGVCNVILNGKVVRACIMRWKNVPEESQITTIEGVGTPENLVPRICPRSRGIRRRTNQAKQRYYSDRKSVV